MLQYKIPQNVGIEDKIVGPFSLRQLIILAIGGGISYVLFAIGSRLYEMNFIEYAFIALPAILALALAMLRIHNVSFGKFILLFLEFIIKPKKRMWDHRGISALVAPDLTEKNTSQKEVKSIHTEERKNVNLRDLSALLDSGGFEHVQQLRHNDIDEVGDDDLITEAYFGHQKKEGPTENMYWRTREVQKKKLSLLAKVKPTPPAKTETPPVETPPVETLKINGNAIEKETVAQHLANVIREAREKRHIQKENVQPITKPNPAPQASKPQVEKPAPIATETSETPKKRRRKRNRKPKTPSPLRQDTQINTTSTSEPVKFMNKSMPKEGETSFSDLSKGSEIEINLD